MLAVIIIYFEFWTLEHRKSLLLQIYLDSTGQIHTEEPVAEAGLQRYSHKWSATSCSTLSVQIWWRVMSTSAVVDRGSVFVIGWTVDSDIKNVGKSHCGEVAKILPAANHIKFKLPLIITPKNCKKNY